MTWLVGTPSRMGKRNKSGLLLLYGLFLVRQRAPQATDAEHLTPLQLLDERDAVEEFSVHVVA